MKYLLLLLLGCAACAAGIESAAPGNVFVEGEALKFTLSSAPANKIRVSDFYGNEVAAEPRTDNNELTLTPLPKGYYTLRVDSEECYFTVVADPAKIVRNQESPFAVDTALSWLCRADRNNPRVSGPQFDLVIELLRRSGVSSVRERLAWYDVQAGTGKGFDFKHYLVNARKLRDAGIKVLGMTHDLPPWAEAEQGMPRDLLALHRFTRELALTFKGCMPAWEFWNEADHGAHKELPWNWAAAQKAACLGFKAGDAALPVLHGSFCRQPLDEYAECFLENDTAYYFDAFNYHTYRAVARYPEIVGDLRRVMQKYNIGDMPIWMTESGSNAEGESELKSFHPKHMQTSPRQDRLLAEFFVKSPVVFHSLGVARNYSFVLPPYNERSGAKDWGMLRRDYSAKPQYAAFATLCRKLGNARYLGEYGLGPGKRGFLFEQPDKTQTLIFWLESAIDRAKQDSSISDKPVPDGMIALPGAGELTVTDIVGTEKTVSRNAVPVSRYPAYADGLTGLKPSKEAPSFGRMGALETDRDLTIVLNPFPLEGFEAEKTRFGVLATAPAGKVKLEIFNLSNEEKTGRLAVRGVKANALEPMTLKPMSKEVVMLDVSFDGAATVLEVGGSFNGREISRCRVPLRSLAGLEHARSVRLDTSNPKRWRANASGKMTIEADPTGDAMLFKVLCGPGDRWVYPEYDLKLPAESMAKATAVRFEWRSSGNCRQGNLMLAGEGEKTRILAAGTPAGEWKSQTVLLPPGGAEVKTIRIGVNPREDEYEFQLRNLEILY